MKTFHSDNDPRKDNYSPTENPPKGSYLWLNPYDTVQDGNLVYDYNEGWKEVVDGQKGKNKYQVGAYVIKKLNVVDEVLLSRIATKIE